MVVTVKQDEVAAAQHCIGNDLVGGAGAIEDEIGLVRPEYLRGITLRFYCRAFMDKQVAEIDISVA